MCVYLFFTALWYKNASSKCTGLSRWHRRSEIHIHPPYMNNGVDETKELYLFTCKLYLRATQFRRSCFGWRSKWWGLFFLFQFSQFWLLYQCLEKKIAQQGKHFLITCFSSEIALFCVECIPSWACMLGNTIPDKCWIQCNLNTSQLWNGKLSYVKSKIWLYDLCIFPHNFIPTFLNSAIHFLWSFGRLFSPCTFFCLNSDNSCCVLYCKNASHWPPPIVEKLSGHFLPSRG